MTGVLVNEIRRGFYLDSVALMRLSRSVAEMEGISGAALMMGTPANLGIMADAGLLDAQTVDVTGGDLVIAIAAADREAADAALIEAGRLLSGPMRRGAQSAWRPHTLESACAALPGANLALISVAGEYAAAAARNALGLGLHAMLFSDNVSIEDEAALKNRGRELGLMVLGPDCGTAILNGVPLAFANRVPRGSTGIIGASGTGIQEVSCLIARAGGGISHAIGVGGRDLSSDVGGVSTLMALDALDRDEDTAHVVIISKPPSDAVAARVLQRVAESPKTFTICFLGSLAPDLPANAGFASTLKASVQAVPGLGPLDAAAPPPVEPAAPASERRIRGLFCGGTLCAEAQVVLLAAGQAVSSNVPVAGADQRTDPAAGHLLIDFGDDEYTRGRPHPMIDPQLRDEAVADALQDPSVGVVLLDLVLGYGAHPDPAGHLCALLEQHRSPQGPAVVASVTGTDEDPQVRARQVADLRAAQVAVAPCNADAASLALARLTART